MTRQKATIRKIVRYLNNPEKDGGFWLPNIQRPFVWREEQIERLDDSLTNLTPDVASILSSAAKIGELLKG
jgi:uncharacterized protein with ParB-like and HNH nuclease domain